MRPPLWKSLLSHIHEVKIEDTPSYINPHLYVILSRGRYQLVTTNAIYSFADLYGNFFRAFEKLRWEMLRGDEVLLLGFGLGSIPYMLEKKFQKAFHYTAVELDEQVIYLAGKYVLDELKSPFEIHHVDATKFISNTSRQWDLICVDLFIDDVIPSDAQTIDYMICLRESLTTDGILLYNCLARTNADVKNSRSFLNEIFLPVFPEGGYLDVRGNWILINDNRFLKQVMPLSKSQSI